MKGRKCVLVEFEAGDFLLKTRQILLTNSKKAVPKVLHEGYEGIEANVKQFSYADGGPKDDFRRNSKEEIRENDYSSEIEKLRSILERNTHEDKENLHLIAKMIDEIEHTLDV